MFFSFIIILVCFAILILLASYCLNPVRSKIGRKLVSNAIIANTDYVIDTLDFVQADGVFVASVEGAGSFYFSKMGTPIIDFHDGTK